MQYEREVGWRMSYDWRWDDGGRRMNGSEMEDAL